MKNQYLVKEISNKTIKQFISLAFAQYGSIAVAFISNILITMYMSEESYGSYRYVINILTVVASLGHLGIYYSSARLLTKVTEKEAPSYYSATILLMLIVSVVSSIVLLIVSFISSDNIQLYRMAALFTYSILLQRAFVYMLKGSSSIADISIQTIVPQGLIVLIVVIFAFAFHGQISVFQMTWIYGISYIAVDVFTIIRLKVYRTNGVKAAINEIIIEQRTNGIQIYIGSLVSVCLADVLNVIVASVAAKAEYASYALAVSISIIIMQIPGIMATLKYRSNATKNRIGIKDLRTTLILLLLSYVGLNAIVHLTFPAIYGTKYMAAPNYILTLSIGYGLHGMGDYFNSFLNAHGYGKQIRNGSIATGIVQLGSAAIFIPLWEIQGLIFVRTITSATYFSLMFISYRIFVARNFNNS